MDGELGPAGVPHQLAALAEGLIQITVGRVTGEQDPGVPTEGAGAGGEDPAGGVERHPGEKVVTLEVGIDDAERRAEGGVTRAVAVETEQEEIPIRLRGRVSVRVPGQEYLAAGEQQQIRGPGGLGEVIVPLAAVP